eukprot:COSAG01_NODE_1734_length_9366_cov_4.124636_16_plen_84_part_00
MHPLTCFRARVEEGCHFECRIRCTAAREIPNTVASLSYLLRNVISIISIGLTKRRKISASTQGLDQEHFMLQWWYEYFPGISR